MGSLIVWFLKVTDGWKSILSYGILELGNTFLKGNPEAVQSLKDLAASPSWPQALVTLAHIALVLALLHRAGKNLLPDVFQINKG